MVRSTMRGAVASKIVFAVFIGLGTAFTFSQFAADPKPAALVSGVAFSLAVTLAYLVLYSLQVMPSFSSAEPYSLLSMLPLSDSDVSLVTILSVVRTFDAIVAVAVVAQVGVVAYLTHSVLAAVAMALAASANAVFGVSVSVWLSRVFHRNITRGGKGKGAAAARFVFLVSWGLAAASLGFLFNLVSYVVPALDSAVSGALATSFAPIAFALIHPFSAGLVVASIVFPSFAAESPALSAASLISFAALAGYLMLAASAVRITLRSAREMARGESFRVVRERASDFLLGVRRPIRAYVLKDIRVASKSPATAFIFALPVLETVVIALTLNDLNVLRAYSVISSTALGCMFTLISASILLNTEGSGLDYTLTLPLSARVIVLAKSTIATIAFLPVPAVVAALLIIGRPAALWLSAIPILETAAVSAATSAELTFFIRGYRRAGTRQTSRGIETRGLNFTSIGDLARLVGALVVAGTVVALPLGAYGAAYLLLRDHAAALGWQAAVALGEFALVHLLLRRG